MKKFLTTIVLLALIITGAKAQLLYKINGKDLKQPSYVVGTEHLAPVSFVDSIKGIRTVMKETSQVYGEVDMQDMLKPDNIRKIQEAMLLPEGKTLKTIFTADELKKVNTLLMNIMGVDMNNPMVEQQMGKMTPQALSTQLQLLMYMKKHPGFNPNDQIDNYFQQEALKTQKKVGGLETVDYQIKALFKGLSIERQKVLLLCAADNLEKIEKQADDLIKAYFAQDLNELQKVMDEKDGTACDSTPEEDMNLIYSRNANWAEKMPAIMKNSPTLFVVGAGHLPGSRGLLELLKKAGYTVQAVR